MGCTPSKQIDASREDSDGIDYDSSVTEKKAENEGKNVNGNSKSSSNGTGFEKSKSKHTEADSKMNKSRRILASSKSEKKCTQSQLDFFEMLDKRIEAGADYASEDERGSYAWADKRWPVKKTNLF